MCYVAMLQGRYNKTDTIVRFVRKVHQNMNNFRFGEKSISTS